MRLSVSYFIVLASALASSAALAQPAPPPLNLSSGDAKIVVAPTGVGNIARIISCPTCALSGGGAFPIVAAGATQSVGQMTVTGTNAGMAVVANGTGGFMLAIPDGTAAGGNARGIYAIDLQTSRAAANQVVSGQYSMAMGLNNLVSSGNSSAIGIGNIVSGSNTAFAFAIGSGNTVTGTAGAAGLNNTANNLNGGYPITLGQGNTASGQSSIAGGQSSISSGFKSVALGDTIIASGKWSFVIGANTIDRGNGGGFIQATTSGGAARVQAETYILAVNTSGATAVRLTLDGAAAAITTVGPSLSANTGFAFDAMTIVAKDTTTSGMTTFSCTSGIVYQVNTIASTVKIGGVCSLGNTIGTIAVFAVVPTITADTTNGAINISVTPPAGNTDNMQFGVVVRGTFL